MTAPRRPSEVRSAAIGAVAGVIGGVVGALLVGVGEHSSAPAAGKPTEQTVHSQDVILCTSYALIKASLRHPVEKGMDALPAIAPLRLALIENPDASPEIRDAITDAVLGFDAILAKGAKPHGLSEPPAYDQATVDAAFDRVWRVCGLGG